MGKEIMFGDIEIEKYELHCYKTPVFLEDAGIKNVLLSNKISSDEKTMNTLLFTCMMIIKLNHLKFNHIMLLKTSTYVKRYDGKAKCMYFSIEDDDLLEKYNTI